jgi:hypothetical protein
VENGKVSFFGNDIPLSEVAKTKLWSDSDSWSKGISSRVYEKTIGSNLAPVTVVEFKLPAYADTSRVEFALQSADGKKWWKAGEANASISFIKKDPLPWHPATQDRTFPALKLVQSDANEEKLLVSDHQENAGMSVASIQEDLQHVHANMAALAVSKSRLNSFTRCILDRFRAFFH